MKRVLLIVELALLGSGVAAVPPARADVDDHDQASCATRRLDGPGGPMEHEPVRDQGDTGSCQSHATAILLDSYLFRQHQTHPEIPTPPAFQVSPWPLYSSLLLSEGATAYSSSSGGAPISGVIDALYSQQSGNVCSAGAVPFDRTGIAQALEGFREIQARYNAIGFSEEDQSQLQGLREEADCRLTQSLSLPPGVLDAAAVTRALDSGSETPLLSDIINRVCSGPGRAFQIAPRPTVQMLSATGAHGASRVALRDRLDSALDDGQPAAIDFCSSSLHNPPPSLVDPRSMSAQVRSWRARHHGSSDAAAVADICGPHLSVISGRMWRNGRCMYLIHNSWGSDCSVYQATPPEGASETDPPQPGALTRATQDCEDGRIWVDEQELTNVISVSTLQ